jgi:molybdopterin-biosynthesis enzyme MoeA-like protein
VESEIAEPLRKIQNKYKGTEIGSYPFFKQGKVGVSIVVRSTEQNLIFECYKDIKDFIKKKKIETI